MIDPRSPEHNYVVVSGVRSPGRAQITGVSRPYNWQIQEGYGREGAFIIFKGRGIAKPTLTIAMWKREHFIEWEVFSRLLEPPTPAKPFWVEMRHPRLSAADIKAVSVEDLGQPERSPQGGPWLATIKLIEYRPMRDVLITPKGPVPAVDKGKPIEPKTEAEKAMAAAGLRVEAALTDGRIKR